jgi:hypothetical protein
VRVAGATDAPGGKSAGCLKDHFTVWKVQPRRVQTQCAKSSRAKSGAGRREVAAFRPSKPIDTKFLKGRGGSSLRRRWRLNQEAGLRSRLVGTIRTRLGSASNKTPTMRTAPSSQPPSPICSHEQVVT